MIGSTNASASLSGIYNNINSQLSDSLAKIASGKRTYKPTDDFSSYIKAGTIAAEQLTVQRNKESIAAAREVTMAGVKYGQKILEQVSKLNELAQSWAAINPTDTSASAAIKSQADAIVTSLNTFIDGAKSGSISLKTGAATGGGVTLTTAMAAVAVDVSSGTLAANAAIQAASKYMAGQQANDDAFAALAELNDTVSAAKINTQSAIEDINDVTELAKVTDLQVRSQASVAMMAQANSTRAGIARLFM